MGDVSPSAQGVKVTRLAYTSMSKIQPAIKNTRLSYTAMGLVPSDIKVTRLSYTLMGLPNPNIQITRLGYTAMTKVPQGIKVTRLTYTGMVKPPPKIVEPRPFTGTRPDMLPPDWIRKVKVTTAWDTEITQTPVTGTEDRRGLLGRPWRRVEAQVSGLDEADTRRLMQITAGMSSRRLPFPIYCDACHILFINVGASTVLLGFSDLTVNKRFYVGGRVVAIVKDKIALNYTVDTMIFWGQIIDLTQTTMTIKPDGIDWPSELPAHTPVFPCLDGEVSLRTRGTARTDQHTNLQARVDEEISRYSLPPSTARDFSAPPDKKSDPILVHDVDWGRPVSIGYTRPGSNRAVGRGRTPQLRGPAGLGRYSVNITGLERSEVWHYLQFFDYVEGSLRRFYMVEPVTSAFHPFGDLRIDAKFRIFGMSIIDYGEVSEILHHLRYIGFVLKSRVLFPEDGLYIIAEVRKVQRPTGALVPILDIEFEPVNLFFPHEIDYIAPAMLCRLDKDTITETWSTDETAQLGFSVTELFDEGTYGIPRFSRVE